MYNIIANNSNIIISDKSSNNLNYKLTSAYDDIFLWSKHNTYTLI